MVCHPRPLRAVLLDEAHRGAVCAVTVSEYFYASWQGVFVFTSNPSGRVSRSVACSRDVAGLFKITQSR